MRLFITITVFFIIKIEIRISSARKSYWCPQEGHNVGKKLQILIIGHNDSGCTTEHLRIAYEVGWEVAKADAVLLTGGLGGVMKAASHGSHDAGGLSVGIIPQDDASFANEYCDIVIPTGMGLTRDFLNALSADGIIIIGGGSGTLSEICAAYMHRKPMVAIRGTGGAAEQFIDDYVDYRKNIKIIGADSAKQAVEEIFKIITA